MIDSKKFTTTRSVCEKIIQLLGMKIDYSPILVAKSVVIREAIMTAIRMKLKNIIIKSDSQMFILFFMDKTVALK